MGSSCPKAGCFALQLEPSPPGRTPTPHRDSASRISHTQGRNWAGPPGHRLPSQGSSLLRWDNRVCLFITYRSHSAGDGTPRRPPNPCWGSQSPSLRSGRWVTDGKRELRDKPNSGRGSCDRRRAARTGVQGAGVGPTGEARAPNGPAQLRGPMCLGGGPSPSPETDAPKKPCAGQVRLTGQTDRWASCSIDMYGKCWHSALEAA